MEDAKETIKLKPDWTKVVQGDFILFYQYIIWTFFIDLTEGYFLTPWIK
jgi:hypothetical protein